MANILYHIFDFKITHLPIATSFTNMNPSTVLEEYPCWIQSIILKNNMLHSLRTIVFGCGNICANINEPEIHAQQIKEIQAFPILK